MSNSQNQRADGQASLTDIGYDDHAIPDPPEDRITTSIDSSEDFYNLSQGDVIWVKGDEYVIVKRSFGIFHHPLRVIGKDGKQGRLIGGTLSKESSYAGVAWAEELPDDENPGIRHVESHFDHVYRLEEDRLDLLHQWTPDAEQRECPACDSGRSGEPVRIERQASKAVELRSCTNTDCFHTYRYVREFPEPDSATILAKEGRSADVEPRTVSGVFACKEQDDFKFPLETNSPREDGLYTASEVADFVNPKMAGEDQFGVVRVKNTAHSGLTIKWQDAAGYAADMTVTFTRIGSSGPEYGRRMHRMPSFYLDEHVWP